MKTRNIDRIGYHLFRCPVYSLLRQVSSVSMPTPSDEMVDIVIPVIPKDLNILPFCLEGIKKNVSNKIKDIYIVGPEDNRIIEFVKIHNLSFVSENDVLGFGVKDVKYITNDGVNRSGWLFQQFLKLSGNIGTCENFITVDSDHILIRPHVFFTKEGKFVFYRSEEFHLPYMLANKKLLGSFKMPLLSNVAHKMIFNKSILCDLKTDIEERSNMSWIESIMSVLDKDDTSAFSEFELYAQYVKKELKINKLWLQEAYVWDGKIDIESYIEKHPHVLSITYPDYLTKK